MQLPTQIVLALRLLDFDVDSIDLLLDALQSRHVLFFSFPLIIELLLLLLQSPQLGIENRQATSST